MCETNCDSRNEIMDSSGQTPEPLTGCVALSRRGFITRSSLVSAGLVIAPTVLIEAIAARPAEAQLFKKPGVADQKKIGQQAVQQILRQYKQVNDSRATHFREMGQRLVSALPKDEQSKWDYNFRVLDSKEVNAFALPGGPMFMFTGLYNLLATDDALAAVTGHEMAHVYKEHWAKAYTKSQNNGALLSLGAILIGKGSQTAQTIAGFANSAISKKFSRSEEDEADKEGLKDLVAANYNPKGMIQLFQVLQKQGGGGGIGGEFLADHPLTSNRIKNAEKRIVEMGNRSFPPLKPLPGSAAAA
ncbi:MAG: M48 family metalloprotease [Cytophagales bacterium]|nr:M48 family metalloprotease [Armatimonadota bacterium]